jgi:hypothetical protein
MLQPVSGAFLQKPQESTAVRAVLLNEILNPNTLNELQLLVNGFLFSVFHALSIYHLRLATGCSFMEN